MLELSRCLLFSIFNVCSYHTFLYVHTGSHKYRIHTYIFMHFFFLSSLCYGYVRSCQRRDYLKTAKEIKKRRKHSRQWVIILWRRWYGWHRWMMALLFHLYKTSFLIQIRTTSVVFFLVFFSSNTYSQSILLRFGIVNYVE